MSSSAEGNSESIPDYVRQFVFERDDWRCQTCDSLAREKGGDVRLEIHHKTERQSGGSNDPDNLSTLCQFCHRKHHSGPDTDDVPVDVEDVNLTPADCSLLSVLDDIGPATIREVGDESRFSSEHLRRRAYRMGAHGIVAMNDDHEWDYAENVDSTPGGELPDGPGEAARATRDEIVRRLLETGLSVSEVGDVVDLDPKTVAIAADRARAFNWPLPSENAQVPDDPDDISQRIAHLACWMVRERESL